MTTKKAALKKLEGSTGPSSQKTERSKTAPSSQKKLKKVVSSSQTNEGEKKKICHKKRSETFSKFSSKFIQILGFQRKQ
jgi:hypothetical protein